MFQENKGLANDKDLEQGMVSKTPPHCQILKLISKFSPALSLFNSRNRLQEDVVVHCKRMKLAFAICMMCVAGGDHSGLRETRKHKHALWTSACHLVTSLVIPRLVHSYSMRGDHHHFTSFKLFVWWSSSSLHLPTRPSPDHRSQEPRKYLVQQRTAPQPSLAI